MIRRTQMLIFFGAICLISITGVASSTNENLSQTSQCIQPINYNISLEIQNASLIVKSNVVLNMSCEQQYIRLQLGRHCNITKVDVKTAIRYDLFSSHWETIQSNTKNRKHVDISLNQKKSGFQGLSLREERKLTLKVGIYTIHSVSTCTLKKIVTVDSYRNQTETTELQILALIPNELIFPYWENPAIKARFTIQIEHKNTDKVISNMPIKYLTNGTRTLFFTTPLISTHSVAFIVIPNVYKTNSTTESNVTITSRLEIKNETDYARTLIFNMTKRIRNIWNDIIPRSDIFYVLLPITSSHYESLVTPGFVFLSEVNSIYHSKVDTIIKEREVTCFIARNVIQEIFSDWLPRFEQSDSWFFEGFLTVYGVYIWDESLLKSIVVQTRRSSLDYIEAFSKNDFPIQENPSITRTSTLRKLWQEKAFSTFCMLTKFAGDILYNSIFKEALHSYYITDNASTTPYNELSVRDKLWRGSFEASFNKSTYNIYFSATEIKRIITLWTTQVGYPVLQVKQNKQSLTLTVKDCFDVDHKKPCEEKWWIPVTLYQILESEIISTSFTSLKPGNKYILSSLFNENVSAIVDSAGYRVNYDRQSWKNIAFFLKNVEFISAELSDVTLAQILDDAFYFLIQTTEYNENPFDDPYIFFNDLNIYLELASSIFHENNSYIASYPVIIALENMSKIFPFSDSFVSIIKEKLLEMLHKFSDDISYTHSSENNVRNQFYHEVLKWTCFLGGFKCKEHVNKLLEWHFEYPVQNKLLPSWQKWIYCQGLMLGTYKVTTLTQQIFNIYWTQNKEKEFFELLPCFRQFENLTSFLRFLDQNSLLQSIENDETKSVRVSLLFNIVASYSNNEVALSIILSGNYLGHKLGINLVSEMNILAIINCIINNIYSEDGLSMITKENFLNKLLDKHYVEPFVLDVIKNKAESRRIFLVIMQNTIRSRPKYFFNNKQN